MDLTKEQLSELICKHSERENGLQDLMGIMLESMMVANVGSTCRQIVQRATRVTVIVQDGRMARVEL